MLNRPLFAAALPFSAIHCINFALFRMEPGAQLWGWLVSYALYNIPAVLLPSIALEEANMSEAGRLQKLVEERTHDLKSSLQKNDKLFKMLVHDISNPLTAVRWYLNFISSNEESTNTYLGKAKKSQEVIENIIQQVRDLHVNRTLKAPLHPVSVEECLGDIDFIFANSLAAKHVTLRLSYQLRPGTLCTAERISFTHSVLGNLISNSLKFTRPHTTIDVTVPEDDSSVIIEVLDQGPGIPEETVRRLFCNETIPSSPGTEGELGSGLGLYIVKSLIESYGGQLTLSSPPGQASLKGTLARLRLQKA